MIGPRSAAMQNRGVTGIIAHGREDGQGRKRQQGCSISDWVLTMVFSSGKVWNDDRNRQPAFDSTEMNVNGDSASRLWGGKWCRMPRLPPSTTISSWTCRKISAGNTST